MRKEITSISQHGAALVVGLVMLVALTVLMISAFTLSSGNLKAVSNMQFRNEAIAAANIALEQTINLNYVAINPADYPSTINIDIDQDNTIDYVVTVKIPQCIKVTPAAAVDETKTGVLGNIENSNDFISIWEIEAVARNESTGATATAKQGISKRLTLGDYLASFCFS